MAPVAPPCKDTADIAPDLKHTVPSQLGSQAKAIEDHAKNKFSGPNRYIIRIYGTFFNLKVNKPRKNAKFYPESPTARHRSQQSYYLFVAKEMYHTKYPADEKKIFSDINPR